MGDGIALARRGVPCVALVTTEFEPQADFTATASGMPDVPRVVLPHPIAGTAPDHHTKLARQFAMEILTKLENAPAASEASRAAS